LDRRRAVVALFLVCASVLSALEIAARRQGAPFLLILLVASTAMPLLHAWRAASGTALRPALVWAMLALGLVLGSTLTALSEPVSSGRPWTGRLSYLAILCLLAAFGSVLNARVPGNRVWAGLMALLVLVFLIPWLEASLRMRRAGELLPLYLDSPWNVFFAFMVVVGVTNYVPTRFAVAAVGFGITFLLEFLALTHPAWPPELRAVLGSWLAYAFAASVWLARYWADRGPAASHPLERLWFWFRDAWGVVWALRILDRFNRTAVLKGWPVRLSWFGLATTGPPEANQKAAVPSEAIGDFRALARRFAKSERLERIALGCNTGMACDRTAVNGS
jgi:hypothetical protein